jgi:hypothetical protein
MQARRSFWFPVRATVVPLTEALTNGAHLMRTTQRANVTTVPRQRRRPLTVDEAADAMMELFMDSEHPHRARRRGDEAVCGTCDASWPCRPILGEVSALIKRMSNPQSGTCDA